ncbi:MAG: 2-hydroxychromene-2-carboxylate isomerase [Acidiferrobacterales bacterium]|nr:2-hydroxychromene-2-carboxylate isomerase [Acidiferrobacterales bacterium]
MKKIVDFYFDFSSPYGYLSSEKVDDLAARCDCEVVWRPYLMGAVMKITERKPLVQIPMLRNYSENDLERFARFEGIELNQPSTFPIATVAACRAYYWLQRSDKAKAKDLAQAIFRAYFIRDELISQPDVVVSIAEGLGVNSDELGAALEDLSVKQLVRDATDNAVRQEIFGSPFFVVDNEQFWGHDRMGLLEAWIKTGGW